MGKKLSSLIFILVYISFAPFLIYANEKIREFKKNIPLSVNASIGIENINGNIRIESWKNNSLDIYAKISGEAQKDIDLINIEIIQNKNFIKIKTKPIKRPTKEDFKTFEGFISFIKRLIKGFNAKVDYYIKIPYQTYIEEVKNINGDIIVKDVKGYVESSTINGEIILENLIGKIKVETVNGPIKIYLLDLKDDIIGKTVNGGIEIYLPEDINAKIYAENINGEINSDFPVSISSRIIHKELKGLIGKPEYIIKLKTINGDISILKKGKIKV